MRFPILGRGFPHDKGRCLNSLQSRDGGPCVRLAKSGSPDPGEVPCRWSCRQTMPGLKITAVPGIRDITL